MNAVLRVKNGENPCAVMKSLGMSRTVIYRWLFAERERGMVSLRSRQSVGPLPKLNAKQQQKLKRLILGSDPRLHGYEEAL
jgi:transposase